MRGAKRFQQWKEKLCNFNRLTGIRVECTLRDRRQATLFLRRRRGSQGGSDEGIDVLKRWTYFSASGCRSRTRLFSRSSTTWV
ncbi:hypothetical protein ABIB82_001231 [Bradyrhizobium sp. i1.8.4]